MRIRILVLLALFSIGLSARADFSVSPWLAPTIAWLRAPSRANDQSTAAFKLGFGVQLEQAFSPLFRLVLEPRYAPGGAHADLLFGFTGSVKLDHFETALLFSASVIKPPTRIAGSWEFQLFGGGFFGVALSRKIELLSLVNVDLSDRFKSTNFGLDMGFLTEYWMWTGVSIRFTTRFVMGLDDISRVAGESYFTRQIRFTLGCNWVL